MANDCSGALLLADMIEYPDWSMSEHKHLNDIPRAHGLSAPNKKINLFREVGIVRDCYPNFERIGFETQAFVDIALETNERIAHGNSLENDVRQGLNLIPNIVLIYTIFGSVDIRCKVVGMNLRQIEKTAMKIREIPGVKSSNTSIIVDETDYNNSRKKWADLIRANKADVEKNMPVVT